MWSLMWPGAEPSLSLMITTKQTCLSVTSQPDVRKTIAIFLFPLLNTSVAPNSLWLDSKSLAWHRFQVMIRDVISAKQESKQRRYLQKVSHMLNQWLGRGGGTAASPTAIWQVTHTHTHTHDIHTHAAGIILIILCVDVEENETRLKTDYMSGCDRQADRQTDRQTGRLITEVSAFTNVTHTCGQDIWRAVQTSDQNQANM